MLFNVNSELDSIFMYKVQDTAAWKYYPTILLSATTLGFP